MTDLLAKYGVNAEIRENASGDVILRNSTTGTEIRLADLIDVVGGANFADGATFPSDQKAFFGNDDQASIRYDATAGAWVVRDETAGEDGRDVQTIPSAGDAIEFASALGTAADPVPGTSHLESVSTDDLEITESLSTGFLALSDDPLSPSDWITHSNNYGQTGRSSASFPIVGDNTTVDLINGSPSRSFLALVSGQNGFRRWADVLLYVETGQSKVLDSVGDNDPTTRSYGDKDIAIDDPENRTYNVTVTMMGSRTEP